MSKESAEQFVIRLIEDKAFADTVAKFEDKEARLVYIRQQGFDFNKADLDAVEGEVISDEKLDDVVGGSAGAGEGVAAAGYAVYLVGKAAYNGIRWIVGKVF